MLQVENDFDSDTAQLRMNFRKPQPDSGIESRGELLGQNVESQNTTLRDYLETPNLTFQTYRMAKRLRVDD